MGWILTASIYSSTDGYSQSSYAPCFSVIPMIYCVNRCWDAVRTLSILPVTTHISLSYNSTKCTTALYIYPWACTVAPVLSIPLAIVT